MGDCRILCALVFTINEKCQWKKIGAGGRYANMNDVEEPKTAGEKMKAGFDKFGSKVRNVFKKKEDRDNQNEAAAASASTADTNDVEAPKTTGAKMKAGFDKFGKDVRNVFKKNPFAKRGGDGDNQTEAAAASAPAPPGA